MVGSIEFYIGKLRALSSLITSKSFMINIEDYRPHLKNLVNELISTVQDVRRFISVNSIKEIEKGILFLDKLEPILTEYFSFVSDKTMKKEKLVDFSSERLTKILQNINDFSHEVRKIEDYSNTIEEIYFIKNKFFETEKIEKTMVPLIKDLSNKISLNDQKIDEFVQQLDESEKNLFNIQSEFNSISEEKEALQERIEELIEKSPSPRAYDEELISTLKEENQKLNDIINDLKEQLEKKDLTISDDKIKDYKKEIKLLEDQLKNSKRNYLDKISKLAEERNVWRSRAIDDSVYSLEEIIAETKKRIVDLEKENRELIKEKEELLKEMKNNNI